MFTETGAFEFVEPVEVLPPEVVDPPVVPVDEEAGKREIVTLSATIEVPSVHSTVNVTGAFEVG